MEPFEIRPGTYVRHINRPIGSPEIFPFRVLFDYIDTVDAKDCHFARQHTHQHYECIVVESGRYRFALNQRPGAINAGKILICQPGDQHEDLCDRPVRFLAVRFKMLPGPSAGQSARLYVERPALAAQIVTDVGGRLLELAKRMVGEGLSGGRFATPLLDLLYQFRLAHC